MWLLDSAGARIQEAAGSTFAGTGYLFADQVVMSGVIPQVAAMLGPCSAGTAYIPGLADFVPMVKGRGSMALAGPHLVRAAVGETVTQEELGGSRVHCRVSGVGDMEVDSDEDCIAAIKEYLSFFPSHNQEPPPVVATDDPIDRMDDGLLDVLPESNRKPYDMYEVIKRIVDDGKYLDIKRQFAKTIITVLARMGGRHRGALCADGAALLDADAVLARIIPNGSLDQIIYRVDALHWIEEHGVLVMNSPRAIRSRYRLRWASKAGRCSHISPVSAFSQIFSSSTSSMK